MVITEKTNFKLSIMTLIFVLGFIIATTYEAATWKGDIENKNQNNLENIQRINQVQKDILVEQSIQNELFVEIRTDLKWIRVKLEE